eukprot:scaffold133873_cov45-Attheya_sp.AAC.1
MFNQHCKVGTDWAAILSIAKRGWGLGKVAASVDSFFGVEISQSTYATRIGDWTKGRHTTHPSERWQIIRSFPFDVPSRIFYLGKT